MRWKGIDVPRRLFACLTAAAAAGAAVLVAGGGQAMAAGTLSPTPCATATEIRIDGLAFNPPQVFPGKSSTATLTATNCTAASQTVAEQWSGTWLSATSSGIPSGCPVIDPLLRSVVFAPHQQVATSTTYTVPAGCTADALRVTVRLTQGGTLLGQRSADLIIL